MSKEVKSDYYTYGLANPLKLSKESYIGGKSLYEYEYFYIGYSGDEKRLDSHLACYDSDKNINKKDIIREIQKAGLDVKFIKIIENVNKQTAISKEIEMISYYGREDLGLGPLANRTNGGDGGCSNDPRKRIDLTGQQFGRLTVLKFAEMDKGRNSKWLCECECGNEKIVYMSGLRTGDSQSCGCLMKERVRKAVTIHGMTGSAVHNAWNFIKKSCYNINDKEYEKYGAKGIKLCERWKDSFENFYEDMGDRPSDTYILGRINTKDNFEPSNCKWMTRIEKNNNRKNNTWLQIENESKTTSEWARISGTNYNTIKSRLRIGWSHKEAVYGKER